MLLPKLEFKNVTNGLLRNSSYTTIAAAAEIQRGEIMAPSGSLTE